MKTLFDNKGISLVVLIVAMTLIAILGTSFVSLMSSKQKGFLYQIDSYRALNIANAGAEYAIRHISDDLSNASSYYFRNLSSIDGTSISLNDDIPSINFAGGTFSIVRNFSYDMLQTSPNVDSIVVNAAYGNMGITRQVKLVRFRRYLKTITLVSDPAQTFDQRKPKQNSTIIMIPIINNNDDVAISKIGLRTGATGLYLQYIKIDGVSQYLFDYNTRGECPSTPEPCKDSSNNGVILTKDSVSKDFPLDTSYSQLNHDTVRTISITFTSTALTGNYEIKFYDSLNKEIGSIVFSLP
ncbi:MAG: hypothetical protein NTY95_07550 [Bacteroidia bacterium]|nr:hypothetical protein [Bacteroidia bacterium]